MMKFSVFENGKLVGRIKADSSLQALKIWAEFAGPGNYIVKL